MSPFWQNLSHAGRMSRKDTMTPSLRTLGCRTLSWLSHHSWGVPVPTTFNTFLSFD